MVKGSASGQHHGQQQQAVEEKMSNLTSASGDAASVTSLQSQPPKPAKKKRGLPGNPDPEAEVIALSPKSLMATNRFVCEICNKGFQRDQNLQLHRRGHNLPWKLKQRSSKEAPPRKKVYICPEASCVHHDPSRALGDLTGIKKHFSRKHGEKKWKCDKCSKKYAVQSDWKAHGKICGTREYRCDCGTLFSRRDSFITHRAFCDALAAEESARTTAENPAAAVNSFEFPATTTSTLNMKEEMDVFSSQIMRNQVLYPNSSPAGPSSSPYLSATALLQKAAQMGAIMGTAGGTAGAGLIGQGAAAGCSTSTAPHRHEGASTLHGFRTQPPDAVFLQEQMGAGRSFGAGLMATAAAAASKGEEGSSRGGGGLQLTRDFLGKRRGAGFSQDGILDMARLDPCNNDMRSSNASYQDSRHAPWG